MGLIAFICLSLAGCSPADTGQDTKEATPAVAGQQSLVVAGGCFWCVESDFEKEAGVLEVISGYSGGELKEATYRNHEGHREVAEIFYDPAVTSYETLVHRFLRSIDVLDAGGQFCDRGYSYSTAVHYRSEAEKAAAEAALAEAAEELGQPLATKLEPFTFFVKAEEYHQDYYKKNPIRYKYYRSRCGRDRRVEALWGEAVK